MDAIKRVVHDVIQAISEKTVEHSGKIERIWQNSVTAEERKHAHVCGVKDGTVSISVDSPVWLYALRVQKKQLTQLLQEECPEVKQICFKIGKTQ